MSTSIHPTPQPDHPRGPRPAFWVGAAGFIVMALLGLTSGITGVLVFAGLYLTATAIFHTLVGRSWVSSVYPASRGKALIGVPAGLVLLITGGLTAPHHPQHSLATATATSPATSAAPTPTSTPTPVATPAATHSATSSPPPSTTTPAATHSPAVAHAATSSPPSSTTPAATHSATSSPSPSTSAHPTARVSPALVPLAKPTRTSPTHTSPTHTSPASQQPSRPTPSRPTTHRTAPQHPETDIVHPGAFCSPEGDTGVSAKGKSMICTEASDGRLRWKRG